MLSTAGKELIVSMGWERNLVGDDVQKREGLLVASKAARSYLLYNVHGNEVRKQTDVVGG